MSGFRHDRIASSIQELISSLILKEEIKDPRVSKFVQFNRIEVSSDNTFAKVFVSTFEDFSVLQESVDGLNRASGFIQGRVGKALKTRNTPKLLFVADTSIHKGMEVNALIEELRKDS